MRNNWDAYYCYIQFLTELFSTNLDQTAIKNISKELLKRNIFSIIAENIILADEIDFDFGEKLKYR